MPENYGVFNVQFHKSLNAKICTTKQQKMMAFLMLDFIKQIQFWKCLNGQQNDQYLSPKSGA